MSYMYSLLNYVAATSKDVFDASSVMVMNLADIPDLSTLHSVETGLRGLSDDEKRTVRISTISVASRLALESKSEEVWVSAFFSGGRCIDIPAGYPIDSFDVIATNAIRRDDG